MFAHRLALELGQADVDGMLAGLTRRQVIRWLAYDRVEPIGPPREDVRHARMMWLIYTRTRSRKDKPLKVADFIPRWSAVSTKAKESWQSMKSRLKVWASAHNQRMHRG